MASRRLAVTWRIAVGQVGHAVDPLGTVDQGNGERMTEVHVVFGCAGEYSDYVEWAVRAYADKSEAEACAARCNAYAKTEMRISNTTDTRYSAHAVPFVAGKVSA